MKTYIILAISLMVLAAPGVQANDDPAVIASDELTIREADGSMLDEYGSDQLTDETLRPDRPDRPGRPGRLGRLSFIGSFSTGTPFRWDHDTLGVYGFGRMVHGLTLRLASGNNVTIGDISVTCRGGFVCYRSGQVGTVGRGYPLRVNFYRALDVQSIRFTSRVEGITLGGSRVDVFLLQ